MNFTQSDIQRLYGSRFFFVPQQFSADEKEESLMEPTPSLVVEQRPSPSFLLGEEKIIWKMKPNAKIALILLLSEFKDPALTALLKSLIQTGGINTDHIGFGILANGTNAWKITDMPVDFAVFFHRPKEFIPNNSPVDIEGKLIYVTGQLAHLQETPALQQGLTDYLQGLNL